MILFFFLSESLKYSIKFQFFLTSKTREEKEINDKNETMRVSIIVHSQTPQRNPMKKI